MPFPNSGDETTPCHIKDKSFKFYNIRFTIVTYLKGIKLNVLFLILISENY